jgi:CRISPR-associated RAMP protein (TIGR02581 family)
MVLDYNAFHSRFKVSGTVTLNTALRVGAGSDREATAQDLPVLKDLVGRPYIPGSSFKGAFRAHLERLLRAFDPKLACVSVPRAMGTNGVEGCLTQEDVSKLKDDGLSPTELNAAILEKMCWTCRLCGAPWFASKLMIRDLAVVDETWFGRYLIRDGVAIDRDTETAGHNLYFNFEAVPPGTQFRFELMIDNAGEEELGLALLGLREFESGLVTLGGGRSRGLGHIDFDLDWESSLLVDRQNLRGYLLDRAAGSLADEAERRRYWQTFLNAIAPQGGQSHA